MKCPLNVYEELQNRVREAEKELLYHKNKCAIVKINASTSTMDIRWLHGILAKNFEDLIYSRRISDGCENKIKLIAPKDDIADALELSLEEIKKIGSSNALKLYVLANIESIIEKLRTTSDTFPTINYVDFDYEI